MAIEQARREAETNAQQQKEAVEQARRRDYNALIVAPMTREDRVIGAIATVTISSGPEQVNHRERERAITIQVTPPPTMALQEAIDRINTQILEPMRKERLLAPGESVTGR